MVWVGRNLKIHPVPALATGRDTSPGHTNAAGSGLLAQGWRCPKGQDPKNQRGAGRAGSRCSQSARVGLRMGTKMQGEAALKGILSP